MKKVVCCLVVGFREPDAVGIGLGCVAVDITIPINTTKKEGRSERKGKYLRLAPNFNPLSALNSPFSIYKYSTSTPSTLGYRGLNLAVPDKVPEGYVSILLVMVRSRTQSPCRALKTALATYFPVLEAVMALLVSESAESASVRWDEVAVEGRYREGRTRPVRFVVGEGSARDMERMVLKDSMRYA